MNTSFYRVNYVCYSFYEDRFYTLRHLIKADNENEAYEKAEEISLRMQEEYNENLFPTIIWYEGVPYFNDEGLSKKIYERYGKNAFLQMREGEWFIYEDLNKPPLKKLEITNNK